MEFKDKVAESRYRELVERRKELMTEVDAIDSEVDLLIARNEME